MKSFAQLLVFLGTVLAAGSVKAVIKCAEPDYFRRPIESSADTEGKARAAWEEKCLTMPPPPDTFFFPHQRDAYCNSRRIYGRCTGKGAASYDDCLRTVAEVFPKMPRERVAETCSRLFKANH